MKLNAPKQIVFIISVILFIAAVVIQFFVSSLQETVLHWVWIVAYILLALGVVLKNF